MLLLCLLRQCLLHPRDGTHSAETQKQTLYYHIHLFPLITTRTITVCKHLRVELEHISSKLRGRLRALRQLWVL